MGKTQKIYLLLILLLALAWFAVFILPNRTGTADATMLSVFEHDEYAQYPNLIQMFRGGETPLQAFKNFLTYLHYYYGFPFYLFSALPLFPVKWLLGADWQTQTRLIVTLLRQLISVLPVLLSALLLVQDQLRSKSPWKALLTFLLLLSLPAVIANNLWWHPDGLLTLFCVLTILLLIRDDGRLGLSFYLSGVTCALAIGTKVFGVLFVATYLAYLVYVRVARKTAWKKILLSALLFVLLLGAAVLVTNPLLLLPIERGEIISVFKANLKQNTQGFYVAGNGEAGKLARYADLLRTSYGGLLLFFSAAAAALIGLLKKGNHLKYLVILTWVGAYFGYFLAFASTLRTHYFIPVVLPLYACLLDLVPAWQDLKLVQAAKTGRKALLKNLAAVAVVLLTVIVIVWNIPTAVQLVREGTRREETSASLALYRTFEKDVMPRIPQDTPLVIYRDWRAYVADDPHWQVIYNWDLVGYSYIYEHQPDLLFIERENALYFADEAKQEQALDQDRMRDMNAFYADVLTNEVDGYQQVYQDGFGFVFASDSLFDRYFKSAASVTS